MTADKTRRNTATGGASPGALGGEVAGTFILVLFGTGAVVATGGEDLVAIALAFGFAVLVAIYAVGHVSGAHINPAVTLALTAIGRFPARAVPAYLLAQFLGGILASLALLAVFGTDARAAPVLMGATAPGEGYGAGEVLLNEALITAVLLFVIVGTALDERAAAPAVGLGIGLTIAAGILATGAVSGASFNPVRSLAPMLVAGQFPAWAAYVAGPIAGGVLGAFLYDRLVRTGEPPAVKGAVEEKPKGKGSADADV